MPEVQVAVSESYETADETTSASSGLTIRQLAISKPFQVMQRIQIQWLLAQRTK